MIIKKLNSVFHRHSKWLFGGFTLVIIVAFMGFLTPGDFGCSSAGSPTMQVGTAFGKKVTWKHLMQQQHQNQVLAVTGMSMKRDLDPVEAFARHCQMEAAGRMGLAVSDREVTDFITNLSIFRKDGKYDPEVYKEWRENVLKRNRISDEQFYAAFRGALLLQKLWDSFGGEVIVTADEVENLFRQMNVKYDVKAASFNADAFLAKVKPDGEALQEFFEARAGAYVIEGKFKALIAEFPTSSYLFEAQSAATEEAVRQYYDANLMRYVRIDEEGKAVTYDAVKEQVKADFIQHQTLQIAEKNAHEFSETVYRRVGAERNLADFFRKTLAETRGARLIETDYIEQTAAAIGEIESRPLVLGIMNAFDQDQVTAAVTAKDAAYVGLALERVESRPATFNEVADRVMRDYQRAEAMQLAREAATQAAEALEALDRTAAKIAGFSAFQDSETEEFSFVAGVQMPPQEFMSAAFAVTRLSEGELTEVLPTPEGAQFALLVKRNAADMSEFEARKPQLEMMARYQKMQMNQVAFQEELEKECRIDPQFLETGY